MAFEHQSYGLGAASAAAVMQRIWEFVTASSVVRFVQDGGVASVSLDGTNYSAATPTIASWASNSYMTIEPVNAYPGGGRWQIQILHFSSTTVRAKVDFAGTWTAKAFTASAVSKPMTTWLSPAPAAGALLLLTASNADTYSAGTASYTYLRVIVVKTADAEDARAPQALYVGGYVPANPTSDTKPACVLMGAPSLGSIGANWGAIAPGTSSDCRAPVEYAHTTLDLSTLGLASCIGLNNLATTVLGLDIHMDDVGAWVDTPLYLYVGGRIRGSFGSYTMRTGSIARADTALDSTGKWMTLYGISHRVAA